MPELDKPGIYVWGDPEDNWHITVAGSGKWGGRRVFKVLVETNLGTIHLITCTHCLVQPRMERSNHVLNWQGEIGGGWQDVCFSFKGPTAARFTLYLDMDGDGDPTPRGPADSQAAVGFVFLRGSKVNPLRNPFLIGLEYGKMELKPSDNFYLGYTRVKDIVGVIIGVKWETTIEELERSRR